MHWPTDRGNCYYEMLSHLRIVKYQKINQEEKDVRIWQIQNTNTKNCQISNNIFLFNQDEKVTKFETWLDIFSYMVIKDLKAINLIIKYQIQNTNTKHK